MVGGVEGDVGGACALSIVNLLGRDDGRLYKLNMVKGSK